MTPGRLRRTLGLSDAVVVGIGSMVGAGVFVVWAPATAVAGRLVLPALLLAAAVAACNALSSSALAVRHPWAGGTYLYGRERLGPFWGYLAGWCFVVGKTASCAAMAMTVGTYLLPGTARAAAVAAVVAVTALALLGVRRSVRASAVIVSVVGCVLVGLLVAALVPRPDGTPWDASRLLAPLAPEVVPGVLGTGATSGVLQAAGLLFFAFAGYARIATLAEEVREPARVLPRAVVLALAAVLVLYLMVGVTVLGVLGPAATATAEAPVADVAEAVWGSAGVWVVGVVAGIAALGALLNLVLGVSRTTLAMARDGHLPRALARVAGEPAAPRVAELAVGAVVVLVVLVADLRGAIGFSSFGVLLYYAVANAAALTLRERRRESAIAALGLAGCLVLAAALPTASVAGGAAVVALGTVVYAVRARGGTGRPVGPR